MLYKVREIKPISKFKILTFDRNIQNNQKIDNNMNFSDFFWSTFFNKENIESFIENKLKEYKRKKLNDIDYNLFCKETKFILDKIDFTKKHIDFKNNIKAPSWEDVLFSYRIFSTIIWYYNDYYKDSEIFLNIYRGLYFTNSMDSIDDYFKNLEYYYTTQFVQDFLKYYVITYFSDNNVYKFDIFWPEELVTVWLISKLLKSKYKNVKIIVSFAKANEQLDFSQWINLIKKSWKSFFEIIDFFIVYRDYWNWKRLIEKYLNKKIEKQELQNVIYYDNWVRFVNSEEVFFNKELLDSFLIDAFNIDKIWLTLSEKSFASRLLPYKCYWNNCNFCAINSQNKIVYDKEYSYNFFIDKWIDFIEKNDIKYLHFSDEAMVPSVIISFAQKIIEKWLKLNYQFRTRYDKLYSLQNCKLLYKSWARFCWMGLESAVDRINENIWNKWNNWITLNDKIRIIYNFDNTGISMHNYSIMWFPWETDSESASTYKFLKTNIEKSKYFTCTPNIFWLMKWPKIFTDRKKMWIEIDENELSGPFKLSFPFTFKWKKRNLELLEKFQQSVHKTQFCPWLWETTHSLDYKDFWAYIDRSYIFYLMKRFHKKNPYYKYKDINNIIIKKDISEIMQSYFNISNYYQIFEYWDDDNLYIYDWVWCKDTIINKKYRNFILHYNSKISLQDNMNNNLISIDGEFKKIIYLLLKDRLLCLS